MKKIILIVAVLFVFFTGLYLLGDATGILKDMYIEQKINELMSNPAGRWWAGLAVVLLLITDILLPVPSSIVMTLSGKFLGFLAGGLVSCLGAMLAALIGFFACRWGGQKVFVRLIGEQDISRVREWFNKYGVYAIILSRPIPMLTEILSCLAGVSQFSFKSFALAAFCGTLPICFVYSYFGSTSSLANPWPAVWITLIIPALGWGITRWIKRKQKPLSAA